MKPSVSRKEGRQVLASRVANIGFILLFPGFYLWNLARAAQLIEVDSGSNVEISICISLLFSTVFLSKWISLALNEAFAGFVAFFLVYCIVWTFWMGFQTEPTNVAIAAVSDSLVLVVSLFALLSIGAYMSENSRKFRAAVWVFLILMSLLTAYFTDYHWLSFDPSRYFSNLNTASYQGFSRSITLTALLALSFIGSVYFRTLVTALCACIIFLAAARAELFGFVFCVIVLEALLSWRRGANLLFLVLLGGCASAILFLSFDALLASRQLEIFDLGNSTSWSARQELSKIAWEQIVQNPLSGLFGGDRLIGGGEYAHNALSAWVTYGFFGFILYYGLALIAFGKSIIRLFNHDVPMARFALYLNTFSLLLITFSAPVFWSVIGLGWGVLLNRRTHSTDSINHRQAGNDDSPKNLPSRDRIRSPPDGAFVSVEG